MNTNTIILNLMLSFIVLSSSCKKEDNPVENPIVINESDPVTDIEGNTYKTVKIGNQVWMVENLKTTRYDDGKPITYVPVSSEWKNQMPPAYCWPNNELSNKDTYGALYNWYTVNTGNLAPEGFHVPSENDFKALIDYLGGELVAGDKLFEIGFKAQGAGQRIDAGGIFNFFPDLDKYWTSTELEEIPGDVRYYTLTKNNPSISWSSHPKACGQSVRCIKNQ